MGATTCKFHRDVMRQVEPIVAEHGGECWFEAGSQRGHGRLVIMVRGIRRFTPVPSTPRNAADAIKAKVCDVRRLIRDIGA